jgi:excinuclease ABC subunit C
MTTASALPGSAPRLRFDLAGWQVFPAASPAELRAAAALTPKATGVYVFLDAAGCAIYVGKSVELNRRLASYARQRAAGQADARPATLALFGWPGRAAAEREVAVRVAYRLTDSESGALITEARLIRRYRPRLNVAGVEGQSFVFVGLTREPWPRLFTQRAPADQDTPGATAPVAEYLGPFTDAQALERILRSLRRLFPYRTHPDLPARCLDYDLGLCPIPPGVPPDPALAARYRRSLRSLEAVLSGQRPAVVSLWRAQMKRASMCGDYETAARRRDDLAALARLVAGNHRAAVSDPAPDPVAAPTS